MKEIIEQLLEGNFIYENGSLDFSCSKLELSVLKDEIYEGSFTIYGKGETPTRGKIFSPDSRMQCYTDTIMGDEEVVGFSFDSTGMQEGEVLRGEIQVVSNQGEYYLPYVVNVGYVQVQSSLGHIRNLFHFANLAKTNWEEAISIYYSDIFQRIFIGNDKQYYSLYKRLSQEKGNPQHMEEFLIAIHKKQKVDYVIDEDSIEVNEPIGRVENNLTIVRNGWGYTRLEVEVYGEFLTTEKVVLSDDDFLGNCCRLPIYVEPDLAHAGKNFGKVILRNEYCRYEIPVTLTLAAGKYHITSKKRNIKNSMLQMMEFYQAYRMKKIGTSTWMKETEKLVEKMLMLQDDDMGIRLFEAQLLITAEKFNEAQWVLERVWQKLEGQEEEFPGLTAYYLYLTTLINRQENYVDEKTWEVEQIFARYPEEWRIAWLLLYLSEEYGKSLGKKWLFLEEQFKKGCTSPVIYIEAMLLLQQSPMILMKLDDFEVQVLNYAAKKEVLNRDIVEQVCFLMGKVREYNPLLLNILEEGYRLNKDKEVLLAICTILIKGNKIGTGYYKWYKLAIEQELRITRLYEYYMLSMDLEAGEDIPKMVLMYFSYHCELGAERNAFLYSYVHRNKERFPEVYESYKPQMDKFITEQIRKGKITRDLAYLYQNMFEGHMVNEETASYMADLSFVNLISVEQEHISKVIVCYDKLKEEYCYPINNKKAYVPIYANEYDILFGDNKGNRYATTVQYTTEKLLLTGKISKLIAEHVKENIGYSFYVSQTYRERFNISAENKIHYEFLLQSPVVEEEFKKEIIVSLMKYAYEEGIADELDSLLNDAKAYRMDTEERNQIIRYLIWRERYDDAFWWLNQYGIFGVDAKSLMRMCIRKADDIDGQYSEELLDASMRVFRMGKYNESILEYLIKYAQGMTKELRNIWNAAKMFDVNTYELSERILIQMLFSGEFVGEKEEIFRSYIYGGAKREVEIAYLEQSAYEYFVKDRILDKFLIDQIGKLYGREENIHRVCRLAYIKYFAENKELITEDNAKLLKVFLDEFITYGIHLPCFKEFWDISPSTHLLFDKVIIEYHANPNSRAVIHYVIEKGDDTEAEYCTEEMTEVFGGVYSKEFVLFFGESLQYYVVEELDGKELLTKSDTIQKSDISQADFDYKFNLINDLVISRTLQDYETVDELLSEYIRKNFLTEQLFTLV